MILNMQGILLRQLADQNDKMDMNITAEIKYLHISPKKMKALGAIIVGLTPTDAIDRLLLASGKGARLLLQVVKSALASAKNNFKLDETRLKIKTVMVLKGPTMKRWQPVSRGMAHSIKKRMTHLKVTLAEVDPSHKLLN